MAGPALKVFGVRHHGPGSARALLVELERFRPDCVLVEGPPDADEVIHWLAHPALILPVALLVYRPDEPKRAAIYPFARFSPEYRALRFALEQGIAVGFMDLPRRHTLAIDAAPAMPAYDIFLQLGQAAGFEGYEAWWNATIEQSGDSAGLFEATLEMMAELRAAAASAPTTEPDALPIRLAEQREAAMRERIRRAAAGGHRRIAAVCGAWHAPALAGALDAASEPDQELLRSLPAVEVAATWIPWTYGRLAQSSGYGAGLASPGWYDHLWTAGETGLDPDRLSARWLSSVAALLRQEGFDVSAGHVIEAVRLAVALAALRGKPYPGLPELEETARSVLCHGDEEPMGLVRRRLIIGERMGIVPPDVPIVPLQRDLENQQARLSLPPEPEATTLTLDLRQETHLERSRLLYRLALLDIPWGSPIVLKGQQSGTYTELWQLQWTPDLSVKVIEAALWGNTVRDAAAARAGHHAGEVAELPDLIALIDRVSLADLPEAMPAMLARIEELSALSRDVPHMLATLPSLAQALRYGGLRQTADYIPQLRSVFDHLVTRTCLALPEACASLDEAAAGEMIERLSAADGAIRLTQDAAVARRWQDALGRLADRPATHPAPAGRATRLLLDGGALRADGVIDRLERALTPSGGATIESARYAADWLDGFLRNSGLLLVHDRQLLGAVDGWLVGLDDERFHIVLPLLRRTFSGYPESIRQQLHHRLRGTERGRRAGRESEQHFDEGRAAAVLTTIGRLLGFGSEGQEAR